MNSFSNLNLAIPDLWEVRDVINKVKNVVLNYTEMEAKVHDATNNEAWGASSTVMQEIAQATFNYQYFNEIMPTIYKRFTEKEAKYWRQIYKSLVLLEYLVKNGSERVVDDARSHVSMIKMMKNFHYVDEKGKDQGINVRSRAKELAELLGDVDTIKAERKKAKKNRNKYTGVGSEGGFGSESNYSSGGGSSSMNQSSFGNSGNDFFDDERPGRYDDFDSPSNQRRGSSKSSRTISPPAARKVSDAKPKQKTAKELNLFDFDEPVASTSKGKSNDDDWGDFAGGDANDDFDDFQSAPITTTKAAAVKTTTTSAKKSNDIFDLLGDDSTFSSPAPTKQPNNLMLSQGMNFDTLTTGTVSQPVIQPSSSGLNTPSGLNTSSGRSTPSVTNIPTTNDTPIGGMWSQASNFVMLDSLGKTSAPIKPTQGPSMNSLKNNSPKQSSAFDDLLF
ncbi:hypothetical protein INT48_001849 [Thamnidium elegans]|uniref:ENTH domain-containing protein n=1 Tax=Thamnidium elegans TaxID=101142 RepID=A0A8H7SSL6_9FUNG|nr:hypothetical protein INT48_001849 [Thamnidium elegans]